GCLLSLSSAPQKVIGRAQIFCFCFDRKPWLRSLIMTDKQPHRRRVAAVALAASAAGSVEAWHLPARRFSTRVGPHNSAAVFDAASRRPAVQDAGGGSDEPSRKPSSQPPPRPSSSHQRGQPSSARPLAPGKRKVLEPAALVAALNRKIQSAGQRRDLESVKVALHELEGGARPNVYTLNAIINACMRCGCSDAVVDSMWERLVAGWGVVPNVVSYNTLLKRYLSPARPAAGKAAARGGGSNGGRSGDSGGGSVARSPLVAAMALVMQMRGAGVRPDDFTYNTLVGIATRQRDMAAAEALVAEMTAVGLRPTPHTLSTLLQGYGALGAVDKALACYEAARRAGGDPNPVARKVLAEACIAGGDPAAAVTVMTELLRSDGGAHADVVACNVLLKALRELGDLDASLRLLSDMPSMGPPGAGGLRPDEVTYNTIVDACCRRGRVALAESVVETMRAAGIAPTATTLNPFIRGHLRRDPPSLDGALAVPAAMEAAGVRPDAFTAALLVAACVQMERPLEGVRRFAALRAAGARMSAISYTVMLRAAAAAVPAAAASPEGAIEAAEAAVMLGVPRLAAAAAAEGGSDSSGSSGDSSGDSSGELRGIGGAPEQSSDSCGGSDGAHLLVVAAENSVADMRAAGVAPLRSNFNALVAVAAAARDMPLARRAWEHMGAAGIAADAFSYGEFVRCCVAADEPAAGVAAVDEAVAEGVQVPLLTFATLIRSFGAVGDVQAADAVFERFKLVGAAARAAAAGAGAALISGGGFGGGVNGTAASDFNRASVVNDVATASG
ncbi:unnamed protein product, partial [Phaeothamnion confervicola]